MAAKAPHVVVSFDMETDLGNWWTTYEGVRAGTPRLLEILRQREVPATFLFTADAAQACPETVKSVLSHGHEVGCHALHHEFLGEANSDTPNLFTLLPEEIDHRLELATEAVAAISGVRPTSFRAPRLQSSNQVLDALERLGYLVDSSYPTYFYGERITPYSPSREDWREPGDRRLLELPLFADLTEPPPVGADAYWRGSDGWPKLRLEGGAQFKERIDRMGEHLDVRGHPNVVCLYLHPWEFVPTPHELVFGEGRFEVAEWLWLNSGEAHLRALDELLWLLRDDGAAFSGMSEFARGWVG